VSNFSPGRGALGAALALGVRRPEPRSLRRGAGKQPAPVRPARSTASKLSASGSASSQSSSLLPRSTQPLHEIPARDANRRPRCAEVVGAHGAVTDAPPDCLLAATQEQGDLAHRQQLGPTGWRVNDGHLATNSTRRRGVCGQGRTGPIQTESRCVSALQPGVKLAQAKQRAGAFLGVRQAGARAEVVNALRLARQVARGAFHVDPVFRLIAFLGQLVSDLSRNRRRELAKDIPRPAVLNGVAAVDALGHAVLDLDV
jgi:hypothetical protein